MSADAPASLEMECLKVLWIQAGASVGLTGCVAMNNSAARIQNGGSGTDVQNCRCLLNQVDVCLAGAVGASFGTVSSNVFAAGSITSILNLGGD